MRTMQRLGCLAAAAVWLGILPCGAATTYHVATNGLDTGAYDGLSWAQPFKTISNAVAKTADGDSVLVSNGTYLLTASILITNAITVMSENGWAETIVTANDTTNRCFQLTHAQAFLAGFTITGAKVDSRVPNYHLHGGAGVLLVNGTVSNCFIRNNSTGGYGAGVSIQNGLLTHCTISNNASLHNNYGCGGGVNITNGLVANCLIVFNSSAGTHGGAAPWGGGVRMTGGVMSNCVVEKNTSGLAGSASGFGGGIGMNGGIVTRCTIRENYSQGAGGGIYSMGGLVVNSLIDSNRAGTLAYYPSGGGLVMTNSAVVVNCTIVRNYSTGPGGGLVMTGGAVSNSIVYGNSSYYAFPAGSQNALVSGGTIANTWIVPENPGSGNVSERDPGFVDFAGGDFRLRPGSPCIDSGAAIPAVTLDLPGNARPTDGDGVDGANLDMGAYEADAFDAGEFRIGFSAPTTAGLNSLDAVFSASAAGSNRTVAAHVWNYGDGVVDTGAALAETSHVYAPGRYTVTLTATNALGETASWTRSLYIKVGPAEAYVSTNGSSHMPPFDSWTTAASNLQAALDYAADGTVIWVTNGLYVNTGAEYLIADGVAVRGINGPAVTTFQRTGGKDRMFRLEHPGAALSGVTVRGANNEDHQILGGGVYLSAGTVSNCVFTANRAYIGGGVWLSGGLVTRCVIVTNFASSGNYSVGAGVRMTGGRVEHSVIASNYANAGFATQHGGGVAMTGGTLRNCLVFQNRHNQKGSGVACMGGQIENCTVVSNNAGSGGNGIYWTAGGVTNTIVALNKPPDIEGIGGFGYSCATNLVSGPGNTAQLPEFENIAIQDYHLAHGSVGINSGTNLSWMGADATDLDGLPRVARGRVDMGAYEMPPVSGTLMTIR